MALVLTKRYVRVSFADTAGNKTTRRYEMILTPVDVAAAAAAIVAALEALTDAEIVGYSIDDVYEEQAVVFPAGNINVEENVLMSGKIADMAFKTATLAVPSPKPGVAGIFTADVGPNANIMDVTDAAVTAFVSHFIVGEFLLSDGEQWENGSIFGRRVHRKSGKSSSYRIG